MAADNDRCAVDKISEAYFEKPKRLETWSGFPLKEFYGPADREGVDYAGEVGDPGAYPYTRGIHQDMYRGRYWTKREVCGFGSPRDTNERLKFLSKEGVGGLNVILDIPSHFGIDSDHPRAAHEIGVTGLNICSLQDMEELLDGIPIENVSMSLITTTLSTPVILAQYIAVAESRGIEQCRLRGTIQNDPVHFRYCGFRPAVPPDLALKIGVDSIEYCTRYIPMWYTNTVNLYDLREQGINAAQEVAFGFSIAKMYVKGTVERDLDVDSFAPRLAFYVSCHMDFFEEIAKIRAARRLWAKIMREEFGAKDPRSLKFKFAVHTAGCSLVPQQPLNNIVRVAYEGLAAVLGGVQSLHCCSYDEPIALPTEDGHRIALRTQQILAYETGVANVSDPLGGSYYIEALTDKIEAEAVRIMRQIDEEQGGMMKAIKSEWVDREMEKAALTNQREIETGERIIVGVNAFQSPPDETTPCGVQRIPTRVAAEQIDKVRRLKETRDNARVAATIAHLRDEALKGEKHNLIPAILEATKAYATLGEIVGTIREAYGHPYDPLEVIESPFTARV